MPFANPVVPAEGLARIPRARYFNRLSRRKAKDQHTIVANRLVCCDNYRVPLSGINGELIHGHGLSLDTISFDYGHVMTINRKIVCREAASIDDTETIAKREIRLS